MNHLKKTVGLAATFLLGLFVAQSEVHADSDDGDKIKARHSRIVSLYDFDMVVANCATGETVASFRALHKYELGGTGQVVPATNPVGLSEHSMIWKHVRGNDYKNVVKMFRFEAGVNNGWIIIRNEISISEDGSAYSGSGVAEIFNSAGVWLAASCPSFTGTRITVE